MLQLFMEYRKFIIFCVIAGFMPGLMAQEFGNPDNARLFNNRFISDQYRNVFSFSPSLLSYWQYGSWSNIGSSYEYERGDFRNAQAHDYYASFNVQTESFYRLEESDWTFYGQFRYANGGADSVYNNISFHRPMNGSPYYLFTQKAGMWKLQEYEFNVLASRQFSEKLSVGARIRYLGDLAFRYNDTRNNQPGLYNELALSASYRLNDHTLSAGLEYQRNKERPQLNNKYPQNAYEEIYNIYINAGLGSYLRTQLSNVSMSFEGSSAGAMAQWLYQNGSDRYSVGYKASFGNEYFIKRERLIQSVENKLLDYKYNKHLFRLSGLNKLEESYLASYLTLTHIRGEGFRWRESSNAYQSNYLLSGTDANLQLKWYNPHAVLSKLGLNLGLHVEDRFDKAFAYTFFYSNLSAGLDMGLAFPIGESKLSLGAGGYLHKNLNLAHDPNASLNSIYTLNIADPLMAYLTADYLGFPLHIEYQLPLQNNMVQFLFEAEPLFPLSINYLQGATFTSSDSFISLEASIKLFF